MELLIAVIAGILVTCGFYMILRRSLVKVLLGLIFIGNAANLIIFSVARVTKGIPPFISQELDKMDLPYADPLPQALILTAIVIGFGTQAFAIALFKKAFKEIGDDDLDVMNSTDKM